MAKRKADRQERDEPGLLEGLDRLLDHRVRLAICVLLARTDAMSFARLKTLLGETDGNLGANLRRLEDAGYITVDKQFADRKPVTWYALAPPGRRSLSNHLAALERLTRGIGRDDLGN